MRKKIIVLTPVKNEDWILDRFLSICSQFADHIIIADQQSTDGSHEIYQKYPKVIQLENQKTYYDEADRQSFLIRNAREYFGTGHILLALDADEMLAYNALHSPDWQKMLDAPPRTILYFEKPSLYKDCRTTIRFDQRWPLGYVDDGAEHHASTIHSIRIPTPPDAAQLYLHEIKFIHYNSVRLDAFAAKQRMYSMIENINNTSSLRHRLRTYNRKVDLVAMGNWTEKTDERWINGWEAMGIDMYSIPKSKYYWYDYAALKMFHDFGIGRFAYDDIWGFDWESLKNYATKEGYQYIPKEEIYRPKSGFTKTITGIVKFFDKSLLQIKNKVVQIKNNFQNLSTKRIASNS